VLFWASISPIHTTPGFVKDELKGNASGLVRVDALGAVVKTAVVLVGESTRVAGARGVVVGATVLPFADTSVAKLGERDGVASPTMVGEATGVTFSGRVVGVEAQDTLNRMSTNNVRIILGFSNDIISTSGADTNNDLAASV
jgi:hypothetical protein